MYYCPYSVLMMVLCPLGNLNIFMNGFDVCSSQDSGNCSGAFDQSGV